MSGLVEAVSDDVSEVENAMMGAGRILTAVSGHRASGHGTCLRATGGI